MQPTHSKGAANSVAHKASSVSHKQGANDNDLDERDYGDEVFPNQWQGHQ